MTKLEQEYYKEATRIKRQLKQLENSGALIPDDLRKWQDVKKPKEYTKSEQGKIARAISKATGVKTTSVSKALEEAKKQGLKTVEVDGKKVRISTIEKRTKKPKITKSMVKEARSTDWAKLERSTYTLLDENTGEVITVAEAKKRREYLRKNAKRVIDNAKERFEGYETINGKIDKLIEDTNEDLTASILQDLANAVDLNTIESFYSTMGDMLAERESLIEEDDEEGVSEITKNINEYIEWGRAMGITNKTITDFIR